MDIKRLKLGELLMQANKISPEQLDVALELQKKLGCKLGDVLVNEGFLTEDDMIEVLEFQLGIPHVNLDNYEIDPMYGTLIPESIVQRYNLIAIGERDGAIMVAMEDPLNIFAMDDVKLAIKKEIIPMISAKKKIQNAIQRQYSGESTKRILEEFEEKFTPETIEIEEDKEDVNVTSAPIVRLLTNIIEQAIAQKASDIHIEPAAEYVRVRYRVDGDLKETMRLGKNTHSGLITRVKIIGKMNIAEKRIPQDGRVEMRAGEKEIDLRLSTIPTIHGEKTVMRILDKTGFSFSKKAIGFSEEDMERFNGVLSQPYGIILVTGPTGSGKSTTLYSVLKEFNTVDRNIITVEDPVEYKLEGINQVQVNEKAGMTFAAGLRSILRQDPDVVMVGEIRDGETAEIAVRAAITGHIVLSTLHTNDSPSTVARLVDMGVAPYLVSSAVVGILSQRLVKKLCSNCKRAYEASEVEKRHLEVDLDQPLTLYEPVGCSACGKGYKGRTAVHELMVMTEEVRNIIDRGGTTDEIRKQALADGMSTLMQSASKLALKGETSHEEVLRIGYTI